MPIPSKPVEKCIDLRMEPAARQKMLRNGQRSLRRMADERRELRKGMLRSHSTERAEQCISRQHVAPRRRETPRGWVETAGPHLCSKQDDVVIGEVCAQRLNSRRLAAQRLQCRKRIAPRSTAARRHFEDRLEIRPATSRRILGDLPSVSAARVVCDQYSRSPHAPTLSCRDFPRYPEASS